MSSIKQNLQLLVACLATTPVIMQADACKQNSCCPIISSATVCVSPTVDYIIVGLGTAGAPLARYLSDAVNGVYTNNVLVLEAGSNYTTDPVVLNPVLTQVVDLNTKWSKSFATRQGSVMNLANFAYTDGRMWGGSSAHNGLWAVRGTANRYDQWATASGNAQWSYANLLPIMKGMEDYQPNGTPVNPALRGTTGPLFITQQQAPVDINTPFSAAFAAMGNTTIVDDFNTVNTGISAQQQYVTSNAAYPTGIRSFSANAFLPTDIVSADGIGLNGRKLRIVSQATVARVLFEGTTAVGVEYILDGNKEQVFRAYANKKVILCAGTTQTTRILLQSGVGPAADLQALGIPVVVDSAQVGKNLQNHYGAYLICNTGEDNEGYAGSLFQFIQGFFDLSINTNSFSYTLYNNDNVRRMQIAYWGGPSLFASFNSVLLALGEDTNIFSQASNALLPILTQQNSKGTITVNDTDPLTIPQVNFNYYDPSTGQNDPTVQGTDAYNIVAAAKIVRATINDNFTGDMIYPTEADFNDGDVAIFNALINVPIVTYHMVGTAAMGTNISNGVVDGNLNVFGTNNLMVADCSVEPIITDGNTAYGAYVIGIKAAEILGAVVPRVP